MKKLGLALTAAAAIGLFAGGAWAGELSMPSSKAAYMYGNIQLMTEAAVEAVEFGNNIVDVDSNTVAVMTVYLKTANQSEIAMDLSLVCALWNENVASSKGGKKETSKTDNELAIRINVDSFKTNGTPLGAATVVPERIVYCEQDVDLSLIEGFSKAALGRARIRDSPARALFKNAVAGSPFRLGLIHGPVRIP